jgi:hypothetical protein
VPSPKLDPVVLSDEERSVLAYIQRFPFRQAPHLITRAYVRRAALQVKLDRVELQAGASDPARRRLRHLPMSFLPRGCLPLRWQEDMMFKVETSTLEEYFAADPGRDADLRAVERRSGTMDERGAL